MPIKRMLGIGSVQKTNNIFEAVIIQLIAAFFYSTKKLKKLNKATNFNQIEHRVAPSVTHEQPFSVEIYRIMGGCRSPPLQFVFQLKNRLEEIKMGQPIRIDNYSLYTKEENGVCRYYIELRDTDNQKVTLEVGQTVYQAFLESKQLERRFTNAYSRHMVHTEFNEEVLYNRLFAGSDDTADAVIRREQLAEFHLLLNELTQTQRRRLLLYHLDGFTYEEIAEMEGCTVMPVKRSIDRAKEKIKKLLNRG